MLKGVNRCLEKVKTSEQPRWLCCPCKQCSLFIDLKGKIIEDTNMKDLLTKLDSETFIFDLTENLEVAPELKFSDISARLIDQRSIEITLPANRDVNDVFHELDSKGIKVASMRNKTNRLEQLFMSRIEESNAS